MASGGGLATRSSALKTRQSSGAFAMERVQFSTDSH